MKRLYVLILILVLTLSLANPVLACDEEQTENYVTQVLFGENASKYESDDKVEMLLNALYLCSEQYGGNGEEKLEELKSQRVGSLPSLSQINIKSDELLECSHSIWEKKSSDEHKTEREKVLKQTVNKVFNFGLINSWFKTGGEKCNSFSALLYYLHILCDYLADDPNSTETTVKGKSIPSYAGQPYVIVNGNRPSFTAEQKRSTTSYSVYSPLDSLGRSGVAMANISTDNMAPAGSRQYIGYVKPSGWSQAKYPGYVNSQPAYLYNRCHLIAHQLNDNDTKVNLITGTRYLNEDGMKPFEDKVAKYIQDTGNHVLYRATPIYEGDNLIASGVQLEAYSVEDSGKGICFNVYCYNVQPGVSINYAAGSNKVADEIYNESNSLPFAVINPSASNPDLIYEVDKHLKIIFKDQENDDNYKLMTTKIAEIAIKARAVGDKSEKAAKRYMLLNTYEYEYLDTLIEYIPKLLKEEDFFKNAF